MTEVPPEARRTRRDEQAERTRRRILDVALDLFAERGYGTTSLRDIADVMGVTKAAVYHHFHAKADILRALSASTLEAITAVADRVSGLPSRQARIDAMIEGCLDVILSRRAVLRVLAHDPAMRTDMTTGRQFAALRASCPSPCTARARRRNSGSPSTPAWDWPTRSSAWPISRRTRSAHSVRRDQTTDHRPPSVAAGR
jgi:AcrR family transcriptional regulator